ncbi:MAG: cytochrome C oxidase subunit IV family protein [Saprospiraceae bacterium]
MAAHMTYDEQKAFVFRGLLLLGAITIVEVLIALLAKGHLVPGVNFSHGVGHILYMILMIGFSLYKAYFIVFYFMHMAYEVRGLAWSVLLPTTLLVWAVIAFFQEGDSWKARREQVKEFNKRPIEEKAPASKPVGAVYEGLLRIG